MTVRCVEISSLAAGGDGVARADGLVVFVPRTAPGDVARVEAVSAGRFARGRMLSLERPSPHRVPPPCPHYTVDRCGGCQIQHLDYATQIAAKSAIIGEALRRIGGRDVPDPVVEPSDLEWRYRSKLTLHLRWRGGRWIAGLHPYDDARAVFDLEDCPITDRAVMDVWAAVRTVFGHLPRARSLRVAVRVGEAGASVVVEGGRSWPASARFFDAVPAVSELWWRPESGRPRRLHTRGAATAGASFAQVNAPVAARVRAHVLASVRAHDPRTVADAYAGMGATAIPLAREGRTVVAIERDADAVEAIRRQVVPPSRAVAAAVEDRLGELLAADLVLLNPPRTGVHERVTTALQQAAVPARAIVYTSCDPATLARDVARLPRYRVASVRGFDMFPQTAHVETVCVLQPEAA